MIAQQGLLDQCAEGADADGLRRGGGDPHAGLLGVHARRLEGLEAVGPGRSITGGELQATAAPALAVGAADDQLPAGAESRPGARGPRPRTPRCRGRRSSRRLALPCCHSRSARIASLRCSREVRLRIRTPSRWSISCWITRASSPDASITIGSPKPSLALTRMWTGRSTSTWTSRQAQAPLLGDLLCRRSATRSRG